ncbi:hypothetical protein BLOT_006082 [Blomia tropicalis]|nr:hypothetical protein BLOT_006082 [Blomia tropicalis]
MIQFESSYFIEAMIMWSIVGDSLSMNVSSNNSVQGRDDINEISWINNTIGSTNETKIHWPYVAYSMIQLSTLKQLFNQILVIFAFIIVTSIMVLLFAMYRPQKRSSMGDEIELLQMGYSSIEDLTMPPWTTSSSVENSKQQMRLLQSTLFTLEKRYEDAVAAYIANEMEYNTYTNHLRIKYRTNFDTPGPSH